MYALNGCNVYNGILGVASDAAGILLHKFN